MWIKRQVSPFGKQKDRIQTYVKARGGSGVIFACAYLKGPIAVVSMFLQNKVLSPSIKRLAIKYVRLEGGGTL